MLDKISNPSSDVFDADTQAYIGKARFTLTQSAEQQLLDYLNYGTTPKSMLLLDLNIYEPSPSYITPIPFAVNRRVAALYAVARDQSSGRQTPFVLQLRYNTITRGNLSGNIYRADSVELSDIAPFGLYWIILF